jgi:hypothetical protein
MLRYIARYHENLDIKLRHSMGRMARIFDIKRRVLTRNTPQPRCFPPSQNSFSDLPPPLIPPHPIPLLSIFGMNPTADRPSLLLALSVVTGLPVLLWAYKVRQ